MLFEIFDESGAFRWRLVAPDGHELASSAESYPSRQDAERAAQTVRAAAATAEISEPAAEE